MQFLLGLALVLAASAAPVTQCPQQNITITNHQWMMPTTLAKPNSYCTYMFSFPSDSYAVFALNVNGASQTDQITVNDNYNDFYMMDNTRCTTGCDTFSMIASWPSTFSLTYYTGSTTTMKMQISITLKKLTPNANIVSNIVTTKNGPSSLLYLSDMQMGASYVITSNSSNVQTQLAGKFYSVEQESQLNGVFVYDGGKLVGTMRGLLSNGFVSLSNTVMLYCVNSVNLGGAVMFTDQTNMGTLNFDVEYVYPQTGYISLWGYTYPQAKEGGAVIVGSEDGKTLITIQQLTSLDSGYFTYQYGGPTAGHNGTASHISNKDLPRTLSAGQMVTFYISKGEGSIKYTSNQN